MSLRGRKAQAISIGGTGFQLVYLDDRQDAGPTEREMLRRFTPRKDTVTLKRD